VFIFIPQSLEFIDGLHFFASFHLRYYCPPIIVASGNRHFAVSGHYLMNYSRTSVVRYFGYESEIVLDSTVEELGPRSFRATDMTIFLFPATSRLRIIGACAFDSCTELSAIIIPPTVRVIGEAAFLHCSLLQEVRFASKSQLRVIEEDAFYFCRSLQPVDVPASAKIRGLFALLEKVRDEHGARYIRVRFTAPVVNV
jgi:hypothetical protein